MKNFKFENEKYLCNKCNKENPVVIITGGKVYWNLDGYKMVDAEVFDKRKIVLECTCGNTENVTDEVRTMNDYLFLKKQNQM
ncbi:MAG: hypothetical protein LLF98_02620 [Clostridium sp.]|uniref:hypothetical protein n=1 Tax=Clostridium sp. TaxID=1506 RepID=UPI0025BE8C09|nr:hypothetical protein [Clostridium sp.]MCE5220177.1 hypothetical protein [Clostridium sp.]